MSFVFAMPRWLCLLSLLLGVRSNTPEVTTPIGQLRGSSDGRDGEVHVFLGIPYAEAPVGDLRWRPPRRVKPWKGLREASSFGNQCKNHCMSGSHLDFSTKGGDEDCLYLNVYAPKEAHNTSQLPCLVFLHGGCNEFGAGHEYNGSNLVSFWRSQRSPALLITVNYRLNIFGFLGSDQLRDRDETDRSTGNYGFQDQRMALHWVQENIGAFGGDPQKVMLFGQSSGAASVGLHLVTPSSYGLYSSAIMMSGGFGPWSVQHMVRKELWFERLMNQTHCRDVDCLVSLSADELLSAYMAIPDGRCCRKAKGLGSYPEIPWAASIDGVELSAHPWDLLKKGQVNQVPILIGSTQEDGEFFTTVAKNLSNKDFQTLFQAKYQSLQAQAELYSLESLESLPGPSEGSSPSEGWWSALRVMTDKHYYCPGHFCCRSLVTGPAPTAHGVFGYVFAHSATGTAKHSDDLPFVFMDLPEEASSEEQQLASEMAMFWYHFAAWGRPAGSDVWPAQSAEAAPMLKFQVASKGGNQVIYDARDRQCAFIIEWLNHSLRNMSEAETTSTCDNRVDTCAG